MRRHTYRIALLIAAASGLECGYSPSALGQPVIEDDERLVLERGMQYSRTMVRMIESDSQPIEEALERFALVEEALADGRPNAAQEHVREATRLFHEGYPRVKHGMRGFGDNLLSMYSLTFGGDPNAASDRRESLEIVARQTELKLKRAEQAEDDFLSRLYELHLYQIFLEMEGLPGVIASDEALESLRGQIEAAVLRNEERLIQLQQFAQYIAAIDLAATGVRPPDFGFGVLDDDIFLPESVLRAMLGGNEVKSAAPAAPSRIERNMQTDEGFKRFRRNLATSENRETD